MEPHLSDGIRDAIGDGVGGGRRAIVEGHETASVSGWQLCITAPGEIDDPSDARLAWSEPLPGPATTCAAMLRAPGGSAGEASIDALPRDLDGRDVWFRAPLPALAPAPSDELVLRFDGLATIASVWVDGAPLLQSTNMFRAHERVIAPSSREVVICCRALEPLLAKKRPRPRWRVPMASHQQLRWVRTTLLGRTPGWSPPVAPVGPHRPVTLTRRRRVSVEDVALRPEVGPEGAGARLGVSCVVRGLGAEVVAVDVALVREGREVRATLARASVDQGRDRDRFAGEVVVPDAARWWPHTHGDPALYRVALTVRTADGAEVAVSLGHVGFRDVAQRGAFGLEVNGVPVFCRGACWTPLDVVSLSADRAALSEALGRVRDAGMNMIRVAGPMVYESDAFHDLLDELGILLWQDFMFANFDYPADDPTFLEDVRAEATGVLGRLAGRPSVAVLCGNSEVEQQAAMFGAPREAWSPKLFHETLPALVRAFMPDAIYWPSSAHGGPFPHDARQGTTSYYGVGAYLRPLDDARRSEVRFATECLAFANVPAHVPPTARVHAPAWKARTPRDLGAGWDFDDVRDHYVARLFGQDPAAVRWTDHDHYLDLGRVATGEVMARTFGEWRRARSVCRGALVWFLRDLWAGAGWGVIDADGQPKPAYFFLKRALAPVAVFLSDEGTGGLDAHLVNDGTRAIDGELEVRFFRGEVDVGGGKMPVLLAPHAAVEVPVAALLEGFVDVTHAHRFGPPTCDVVLAELREGDRVLARALHRPLGLPSRRQADVGLAASYVASARGTLDVTVTARLPAYGVVVEADGYEADDAFFELAPARPHLVRLTRTPASEGASTPPRVTVRALDAEARARAVPA